MIESLVNTNRPVGSCYGAKNNEFQDRVSSFRSVQQNLVAFEVRDSGASRQQITFGGYIKSCRGLSIQLTRVSYRVSYRACGSFAAAQAVILHCRDLV
jgi:hypothetical protein